jgi:hypothetical protein
VEIKQFPISYQKLSMGNHLEIVFWFLVHFFTQIAEVIVTTNKGHVKNRSAQKFAEWGFWAFATGLGACYNFSREVEEIRDWRLTDLRVRIF